MRSGIMAATVPSSRVQIICRCNSLPALGVRTSKLIRPGTGRRGQATSRTPQLAEPFEIPRTEVGHAATRWLHQLALGLDVAQPKHVGELVHHDRALRPWDANPGGFGSATLIATTPLT